MDFIAWSLKRFRYHSDVNDTNSGIFPKNSIQKNYLSVFTGNLNKEQELVLNFLR